MQTPQPAIRPEDAAEALKTAHAAARRSAAAVAYHRFGRRLVVWGVVWALINIAGVVRAPVDGTWAWPAALLTGLLVNAVLDIRAAPSRGLRHAAESLVLALAVTVFVMSLPLLFPSPTLIQVQTLLALVIGLIYIVAGLFIGWRLAAVGAALMLAVVAGTLWAPDHAFVWMAAAGGGGLILGGLWLRQP